ncbi:hypothetical protein Sste5346_009407 [Sporothrix stenoceras]|uniref:F-box domain-containing protein n=1 Tax=Sporothrix stenoceras TaxID=5173 RepID=A0ABR3YLM9_9PEZI
MDALLAYSPAPITRLPNELIWSILQLLDLDDAFGLGRTCRFFRDIMRDNSICRMLVELTAKKQFPFSDECIRMRPAYKYAAALRAVAKRHQAIANLQPFAVAVVAEADVPIYGGRNGSVGGSGIGNGPTSPGNGGYSRGSYDPPPSAPPFVYAGQTLLYMSGRTLRILPLHGGVHKETTINVRQLLNDVVPASQDKRNFHFRPLHYSDGIVSCVYVHRVPSTGHQESWLILFNPTTNWRRSHRLALPHHRLFVRNNKEYLVFGTYTSRRLPEQDTDGEGLGGGGGSNTPTMTPIGHRRWVLRHYSILEEKWSTKAIFLDNSIGLADLGSSLCFEVLDGYFYALANQQRYLDEENNDVDHYDGLEEEEYDSEGDDMSIRSGTGEHSSNSSSTLSGRATGLFAPASYYTCERFPLSDPQQRQTPTRASLWRRRNNEGAVDDRWTTLRLEKSETTGQIMAVESRKEWLRVSGASSSRRTYYMQPLKFKGANRAAKQRRRSTANAFRLPEHVHPGDDAARMMPLTLSRCGARVYSMASQTFMDLYYQNPPASADPLAAPRLVLRAGTRRSRLSSDKKSEEGDSNPKDDNNDKGGDSLLYPLREINKHYVDNEVVTWPMEKSENGTANSSSNDNDSHSHSQAEALGDVLNPPGYCGTITATSWDDRVLIYATTSSDESDNGGRQAIVVVSFDPTLCLPGLEVWGKDKKGEEDKEEQGGSETEDEIEDEGLGYSEGALPLPAFSPSRKRKLSDLLEKDGEEEGEEHEDEGRRQRGRRGSSQASDIQAYDFQAIDFNSQATSIDEGRRGKGKETGTESILLSPPASSPIDMDEKTAAKPSWVTLVKPMYRAIGRGFDFSYHKRNRTGDYLGPL